MPEPTLEPTYVVSAARLDELFNAFNGLSTYQMQLAQSDPAGARLAQAIISLAEEIRAGYSPAEPEAQQQAPPTEGNVT